MKNRLKTLVKMKNIITYFAVAVLSFLPFIATAESSQEYLDNLSFKEMIHSVELGDKSSLIQQFQENVARENLTSEFDSPEARKKGYRVETFRNKEVLLVTIPANELFAPNDTELLPKAGDKILSKFKKFLYNPDTYRVLLVMHTDNTGSELYRDIITEKRVDAVFDWFENQGVDTSFVFPYAMGDDLPFLPNDSQENRTKNRRLEIYLMPGEKMLEMAKKKGKIEFK